jgi:hypothetical protein
VMQLPIRPLTVCWLGRRLSRCRSIFSKQVPMDVWGPHNEVNRQIGKITPHPWFGAARCRPQWRARRALATKIEH